MENVPGLGIRLGQSRTKLELTQNNLADIIGISRPNYTAIENGNEGRFLKDYQLKNAAQKLKVSSDYLLGLIKDPNPNSDLMGITKSLGISSKSAKKLQSFKSCLKSDNIPETFDSFITYFDKNFWELISLYKRLKTFYKDRYPFILNFTNDIESFRINSFTPNVDFSQVNPFMKYFYYDIENSKNFINFQQI